MRKILFFIPLFLWTCGGGGGSSPTEPEPPQLPTVQNINLTATEDTPKVFTFVGTDPLNLALSYSVSTQPQNGTVVISGGSGTYTPNANYNGQDIFLYLASSVNGNSNIGTVVIDIVAVDDDPNTMDVSVTTDEDNVVTMTLEAEEVDGQTIQFNVTGDPSNGSVTISGTTATYSPNQDWFGTDTFNFEAVDVASKSILNNATGTIVVNPINDAPTVDDIDDINAVLNQTTDITLIGNDVENDNLTFSIETSPSNGTISVQGNIATYTGQSIGSDSFTYKANDGTDDSNVGTVSISVANPNFQVTFGGSGQEEVESVLQTSDGGYALFGYTTSYGAGSLDWYFVKTDLLGNEEFSKTYGGSDNETIKEAIITSDDNYLLGGYTYSFDLGQGDMYVIKIDASGNELWKKTFGSSNSSEVCYSVSETSDGGFVLGGSNLDIIRIDTSGNEVWNKRFDNINTSGDFYSVKENSDGSFMATGWGYINNNVKRDIILLKIDASGNELWHKFFGGSNDDFVLSGILTTDGGYLLGGYTFSSGAGAADGYLIKTDSSGNEEWSQTYGESDDETIQSVIESSDGGYIFTGSKRPPSGGSNDVWVVKVDSSGNEEWNKTFNGSNGYSIIESADGGIVIGGYTQSNGSNDMLLIKVDSEGNRIF